MATRERLIVALDFAHAEEALGAAEKLRGHVGMFKMGSELFTAEGPRLVRELVSREQQVFLDLKFHDIPNTVRAACRQAAKMGVRMVNVHASGGRRMLEAAVEGARQGQPGAAPWVLAVTVLTSLSAPDLSELGILETPEELAIRWARLAQQAGLDGVVASARETSAIRRACGPDFVIVTPGIRPIAADPGDQMRITTPAEAIAAGANYLVLGRPIIEAPDPARAADAVVREMEEAAASVARNR